MIALKPAKINEIVQLEKCGVLLADKLDLILIILKKQRKRNKKSHTNLGVEVLVSKLGLIEPK